MRVGIVILPELRWSEARARWQRAERYGFDEAWSYDHLGCSLGGLLDGPWFDTFATLTAAASVTSTLRLGTMVTTPNFRHPVPLARQALALDDISQGRFTLGLGSGGAGYDRQVLGVPDPGAGRRTARFAEFTELTDALLTDEKTTFHGEFFSAVDARNAPGCLTRPRLPFLVAANGPRAMRVAAVHGQGWLTGPIAGEISGGISAGLDGWWRTVAELVTRFDAVLEETGRDPGSVARYLTLDGAPLLSMSSKEAFVEQTGRAARLGFDGVITHWPRPDGIYQADESVLEEVAADVLPALRG
ncbi:LLM class flavin-dependent oxidoreductase [Actinocorallia lasiicapitis]